MFSGYNMAVGTEIAEFTVLVWLVELARLGVSPFACFWFAVWVWADFFNMVFSARTSKLAESSLKVFANLSFHFQFNLLLRRMRGCGCLFFYADITWTLTCRLPGSLCEPTLAGHDSRPGWHHETLAGQLQLEELMLQVWVEIIYVATGVKTRCWCLTA